MINVFYNKKQSANSNDSFSPSAQKPEKVVEKWGKSPVSFKLKDFKPVTKKDLYLVHDKSYVDNILSLKKNNGFGNTSKDVAQALPWVAGSMVAAALYAIKENCPTFSPTSGAHHAGFKYGGAFCTFNFLVLAAVKVYHATGKKVGIVDLDCHFGDGTEDIIRRLQIDYIKHYTFGANPPRSEQAVEDWLNQLPQKLSGFTDCGLIIYNAGVDSHINDPLGGILTTEQMRRRDEIVYDFFMSQNIPVTTSLAGGYQRDASGSIDPVLVLHENTFIECWKAHRKYANSIMKLFEGLLNHKMEPKLLAKYVEAGISDKHCDLDYRAWKLLGVCLGNAELHQSAIRAFMAALELKFDDLCVVNLTTGLLANGQIQKALNLAETYCSSLSDNHKKSLMDSIGEAIRNYELDYKELPKVLLNEYLLRISQNTT
jgi:acetoin utilization deacetylase AcuC-like enzyme